MDREASISPRAVIHHLIRTAGCSAQTGGLPESREVEEEEEPLLLHHNPTVAEMLSPFTNMSNWAFFLCVCFGLFFGFFLVVFFWGAIHNLFNSQGCLIICRGMWEWGGRGGKKVLIRQEQTERDGCLPPWESQRN